MEHDRKVEMYDKLLSSQIPCLVYSRNQDPDEDMIALCDHYGVPCLVSERPPDLMAEIIRWLKVKLAPSYQYPWRADGRVFGEGVLIMGRKRNRQERVYRTAGIGIIDVKTLFGVEA